MVWFEMHFLAQFPQNSMWKLSNSHIVVALFYILNWESNTHSHKICNANFAWFREKWITQYHYFSVRLQCVHHSIKCLHTNFPVKMSNSKNRNDNYHFSIHRKAYRQRKFIHALAHKQYSIKIQTACMEKSWSLWRYIMESTKLKCEQTWHDERKTKL